MIAGFLQETGNYFNDLRFFIILTRAFYSLVEFNQLKQIINSYASLFNKLIIYLIQISQKQSQMRQLDEQSTTLLTSGSHNKKERRQELGQKILIYFKNLGWVCVAIAVIYYSNFFHHLFKNPNINPLFFQISITGYTMLVMLILYTTFVLPMWFGVNSVEEHNPKLIPIGAIIGFISVISLLIAIWPVWGFYSLLIFICIWKGFFSISVFLPSGNLGNFMFIAINTGTVLSFYIIQHEGYLH